MNTDIRIHDAANDNAAEIDANDNIVAIRGRRDYRPRDIGTGYGRSSGYALDKRYTSDWGAPRFRCA